MRNFYNKGEPTLTKAQKTLPEALKNKLGSKNKEKRKKTITYDDGNEG